MSGRLFQIFLTRTSVFALFVWRMIFFVENACFSQSNILYIEAPDNLSGERVERMDYPAKRKLGLLIRDEISIWSRNFNISDQDMLKLDLIIIFTKNREPILPDYQRAREQFLESRELQQNELTFTFDSPDFPWTPSELDSLQKWFPDFYSAAKTIYGNPAFNITVNVCKDSTLGVAGTYSSYTNEMTIGFYAGLNLTFVQDVIVHEMIHAFHDDDIIGSNNYEEGMTRATEVEVFNQLGKYIHRWDQNHSYDYDVFYDGLNKPAISGKYGNFWWINNFVLLRYQLAGYAWAKAYLENISFFVNFNQEYYYQVINDPSVRYTESKLKDIFRSFKSTLEGQDFDDWYSKQYILNMNPTSGYIVYTRVNQFTLDYFFRNEFGNESPQLNAVISWSVYDHNDALIDGGSGITNAFGWMNINPNIPSSYTGRLKIIASADSPEGQISDISYRTYLSDYPYESGIFGIVSDQNEGIISITPLDDPTPGEEQSLINGAFAFPAFENIRGRFTIIYIDPSDRQFRRVITKDASRYFINISSIDSYYITVRSPNGGETWYTNNIYNITWTDNISENVKIEIYKTGVLSHTITNSTAPIGSYSWTIPSDVTSGSDYKIKITSTTNAAITDYSDGNFTILPPGPPSPTLVSPLNEAMNQPISLTLDWNNSTGATSYQLQVDDDSTFGSPIYNQSGLTATQQLLSGLVYSITYYWRVNASNAAGASDWSTVWQFTTASVVTQTTPITHGKLNMISFNVEPSDLVISSMLDDLETLLVAQDDDGKFYIPPYGVNTIGNVDLSNGYQVYITGSADDQVVNDGDPLAPQNYSQALNNTKLFMIGYPYQTPHPVTDVFASITSSVVVVQDDEGHFWIPMYGVNTMGNMQPGKGYQIYVKQAVNFIYPALIGGLAKANEPVAELPESSHFQFQSTGLPYGVVVTDSKQELSVGDEVGVFAGELCVGASVFTGQYPLAIASWEGNEEYKLTGFKAGQTISLRVWKVSEGKEVEVAGRFSSSDESAFRTKPISVVSLEAFVAPVAVPIAYGLDQNYPNPFNPETAIEYQLPEPGFVNLKVYTMLGQEVRTLVKEEKHAGFHKLIWDGKNDAGQSLTSGIYLYRIQIKDFVKTYKLIFLK